MADVDIPNLIQPQSPNFEHNIAWSLTTKTSWQLDSDLHQDSLSSQNLNCQPPHNATIVNWTLYDTPT